MSNKKNNQNDQLEINYFNDYMSASSSPSFHQYMFSPMMLNLALKELNMNTAELSLEQLEKMIKRPHENEQTLRKFAMHLYDTTTLFKRMCHMWADILTFDFYPKPYKEDGSPITLKEMKSKEFEADYQEMIKFFHMFNVKKEFSKVGFQCVLFDTYFTSLREYQGKYYLQELPSDYCMIDAESIFGYLFSFDLSYFMSGGVSTSAYHPKLRSAYSEALKNKYSSNEYKVGLPNRRNGKWIQWNQMSPDDAWVFKFNRTFPGSVPPMIGEFSDYAKIPHYKDIQDIINELQSYKVIFGTVPLLKNNKGGNAADNFAISATELGKFSNSIKQSLKNIDFKAAPMDNFQSFGFDKSANTRTITEEEFKTLLLQSGVSDAALSPETMNMASSSIYKAVSSKFIENALYPQCSDFCEYHINKRTSKYKWKIEFLGNIFDKDERSKQADKSLEQGFFTGKVLADKGLDFTTINNEINLMEFLGFPYGNTLKPIKTASTMSSQEKDNLGGRPKLDENEKSDSAEVTDTYGSNEEKKMK
ncbi:hypothetical protein KQI61_07760 [Anaerocolumna aminovalerica]|uniref:hypothetical protein n=1 Tax=Anaerocolumna aminovalerica TaxID=1527 RepID=UPI001C0F237C|nr:hypothetical protein [Anaerocolumna aminovalerica]MBU5332092.1 hypothetical protein [Anaerocolumna aminovalerica]